LEVLKDNVSLIGWASNSLERSKAVELARSVKGVELVDNQLKIKS
jgi:osmotically-inducible protein OsmY